jgi:hypothetical protein
VSATTRPAATAISQADIPRKLTVRSREACAQRSARFAMLGTRESRYATMRLGRPLRVFVKSGCKANRAGQGQREEDVHGDPVERRLQSI